VGEFQHCVVIADFLECPTNFSLSFVEFADFVYPEHVVGADDKLKFVGHSSKSAMT
jgi:hypothetical protein